MEDKNYFTIPQVARILGISRIAVYKKVKKGEIRAIRIGRNYAFPEERLAAVLGKTLREADKKEIDRAVRKTVREYSEVLRLLGNE
jgi:excisionase family DNA binding protein